MATVDKLLIKGIRSFSPHNESVIEFYKPLTLIVGPNGAGKTTVIECLKMATTGEMPPYARNGQAFVMDPKVAGEAEVKAQIKLRFNSVSGRSVVVCRSFQLTEKKTRTQVVKQEFKTLDSTLQSKNERGERVTLTHRCADLDRQVPELMGVSKAILENVVFCHQDDSNWPLDDPKTLKVKFDDIFAATKYTKALEAIRALRTKQAAQVKEYEAQLAVLHAHKEQATRLRENMGRESRAVHDLGVKIKEGERELAARQGRVAALKEALRTLDELHAQLAQLEARRGALEEERQRLTHDLADDVLTDPTEELEAFRRESGAGVETLRGALEAKLRRAQASRVEVEGLQAAHTHLCAQQGKLAGELEAHKRNVRERDRAIAAVAQKHAIAGFAGEAFGQEQVRAFAARADALAAQLRAALETARRTAADEDATWGRKLEELRVKQAAERQAHTLKETHLRESKEAAGRLRAELEGLDASEARLAAAQADEADAEAALRGERERGAARGDEEQAAEAERELRELQAARARLQEEVKALRYQADAAIKLALRRQERDSRRAQADAMLEGKRAALERVLEGPVGAPERLEAAVREKHRGRAERLGNAEGRARDAERRLELTRGRLAAAQAALAAIRQQRAGARPAAPPSPRADPRREGARAGGGLRGLGAQASDVPEFVRKAEEAGAAKQKDLATAESLTRMYSRFLGQGREEHCCPVCERDFAGDAELRDFTAMMEERIAAGPGLVEGLRRDVARLEAEYRAARELEPAWRELQRLAEEARPRPAPAPARGEGGAGTAGGAGGGGARGGGAGLEAEREEALGVLALEQHDEREARELVAAAEKIAGLFREHTELARAVQEEEARLAGRSGARTFDQARAELDALEEKIAEATRRREQLQRERETAGAALRGAENAWREARERRLKLEGTMETHKRISKQLDEAGAAERRLAREVAAAQKSREEAQRAAARIERERAEALAAFEADLAPYTGAARLIDAFVAGRKEQEGAAAAERVRAAADQLEEGRRRLRELEDQIAVERKQAAEQETLLRQVVDNLRLREQIDKVNDLQRAIDQKRAELESIEGHGEAAGALEREERELQEYSARLGKLQGAESLLRQKLREVREELGAPRYVNIDEEYRRMQIRARTTAMANGDLERFHAALDRALMKFHALKMEEINRLVKDTWAITYRGQDIDTIAIRSNVDEGDGAAGASGGRGQRNYNYRVVMVKGGVELDMRGRCSAGQKVLASLIIRLALAEVFGLQCGILALDEPTTNLDAANMESFAVALQNIVKARSGQANFQLVVITHDEEFVRLLGQRELVEYYYRVSKDEAGCSTVAQQNVDSL
eukprot:tig00001093_g6899.t1